MVYARGTLTHGHHVMSKLTFSLFSGPGSRQLRVPGFDMMGCGEARSKKDAQGKAAEMFCNLLAEKGLVDRRELPPSGGAGAEEKHLPNTETPSGGNFPPPRPPGPSHYPPPPPHPLQSNFQQQLHVHSGKHQRAGIASKSQHVIIIVPSH